MPDQVVEPAGSHEPTEFAKTPKKAAASGWIGSALEYYDFFIYAQAAALVFPIIFFTQDNPQMNIVIALATFGVGYVARPHRCVRSRALGRQVRPKERPRPLHDADGHLHVLRRVASVVCGDRRSGRRSCSSPAVDPGLRGRRRIAGAGSMMLEHAPFGRRGYFASFTLQGVQAGQILAAAVFLPLSCDTVGRGLPQLGLADPVPAQRVSWSSRVTSSVDGSTRRRRSRRRKSTARCRRRRSCRPSRRTAATCSG